MSSAYDLQLYALYALTAVQRPPGSLAFQMPAKGLSKFAGAIKGAREEDGCLSLPILLLGNPELGDRILVRESYLMLWARLQQVHDEKASTNFVITGQPGVGKTF